MKKGGKWFSKNILFMAIKAKCLQRSRRIWVIFRKKGQWSLVYPVSFPWLPSWIEAVWNHCVNKSARINVTTPLVLTRFQRVYLLCLPTGLHPWFVMHCSSQPYETGVGGAHSFSPAEQVVTTQRGEINYLNPNMNDVIEQGLDPKISDNTAPPLHYLALTVLQIF